MTEREFYNIVYSLLGSLTPIPADCGRLCNKKCCEGDRDGDGMYLFAGEEALYDPAPEWAEISETDFFYSEGRCAGLISCDGVCPREERPLACRIFPLTPYLDEEGNFFVIIDPRARGMCPMAVLRLSDFDPRFVRAVERVGKLLMKNSRTREFLYSLSRVLDETRFLK